VGTGENNGCSYTYRFNLDWNSLDGCVRSPDEGRRVAGENGQTRRLPGTDIGLKQEPLMRYRGYYVHKNAPPERVEWLKWAFQKAFKDEIYQQFNKDKYMDLVDSFRDTEGARQLIGENIEIYRKTYKEFGLIF